MLNNFVFWFQFLKFNLLVILKSKKNFWEIFIEISRHFFSLFKIML